MGEIILNTIMGFIVYLGITLYFCKMLSSICDSIEDILTTLRRNM